MLKNAYLLTHLRVLPSGITKRNIFNNAMHLLILYTLHIFLDEYRYIRFFVTR